MKFEDGIFEESYYTSFSQTGIHDVLTNRSVLSFMETVAGFHSFFCHYSFRELALENKTWIILNWKLKVLKRITGGEKITVKTWGRPQTKKIYVLRDFKMYNEKGELCAIASSKWCLMDMLSGKIAKLPNNLEEIYHKFRDESVFNMEDLAKLDVPDTNYSFSDKYKIRRFDIDINKHVHNLNYLNFAYEVLPEEVFLGPELNNVEIAFKKEIKYGETIKSFLYVKDNVYTIVIKSEDESIVHSIIKLY